MFGKKWREAKTGVVSDLLLAPVKSSVAGFCTVLKSEVKRLLENSKYDEIKAWKFISSSAFDTSMIEPKSLKKLICHLI